MKKIITILFLLLGPNVNAQITVDNNDMPNAGDTIRLSVANAFTSVVDPTQTGPNFTWDFTALVPDSQVVDSFFSISSTGLTYSVYYANFGFNSNRANLVQHEDVLGTIPGIPLTDPYVFKYNSSSAYKQVGFGATLSGLQVPVGYANKDVIYNFPMNYNDSDSSDSDFSISLPLVGSLNGNQHRINNVDGWGTLITNYGTFDVLRIVSTITAHDSLYLDTLGTGFGLQQPLTKEYKWIGKNQSDPLLEIITQEYIAGFPVVSSIRYKDSLRTNTVTGIFTEQNNAKTIKLFPNPSNGNTRINFVSVNSFPVDITITDVTGRISHQLEKDVHTGLNEFNISGYNFNAGIYMITLKQNGKVIDNLQWMISK